MINEEQAKELLNKANALNNQLNKLNESIDGIVNQNQFTDKTQAFQKALANLEEKVENLSRTKSNYKKSYKTVTRAMENIKKSIKNVQEISDGDIKAMANSDCPKDILTSDDCYNLKYSYDEYKMILDEINELRNEKFEVIKKVNNIFKK